jgi:hypothetical protein
LRSARWSRSLGVFVLGAAHLVWTVAAGAVRPPCGLVNSVVLLGYLSGGGAIWRAASFLLSLPWPDR